MTGNPYPHTFVGEAAWDASIEAGVDLLSFAQWRHDHGKLYLFARYDQYDSSVPAEGLADIGWCSRQVVSGGGHLSDAAAFRVRIYAVKNCHRDAIFSACCRYYHGNFKTKYPKPFLVIKQQPFLVIKQAPFLAIKLAHLLTI